MMNKHQTIDEEENKSVYEVKSTWLEKCEEGKIINIVLFKLFSSLFFGNLNFFPQSQKPIKQQILVEEGNKN